MKKLCGSILRSIVSFLRDKPLPRGGFFDNICKIGVRRNLPGLILTSVLVCLEAVLEFLLRLKDWMNFNVEDTKF